MQTRLFLSFLAFCCIHFLTFVSNSFNKSKNKSENLHPFRFRRFEGFIGFLSAKL